jgi:hypothetical protein
MFATVKWLQYLHAVGLLRASFRPAQDICAVRSLVACGSFSFRFLVLGFAAGNARRSVPRLGWKGKQLIAECDREIQSRLKMIARAIADDTAEVRDDAAPYRKRRIP